MGLLGDIKIDNLGGIFSGVGQLAKDIRMAFTGKEPVDAMKAAEIALKAEELAGQVQMAEMQIENTKLSIALAESQSADKWTSRGRPLFLYVMYIMILAAIPMGILYAVNPIFAGNVVKGSGDWLTAIPDQLYYLFGIGYLGYTGARTWDKWKTGAK